MFQVRIHGRGGQGVVTAAELLSVAAFNDGRYAQAFPIFGSEAGRESHGDETRCRICARTVDVDRAQKRMSYADILQLPSFGGARTSRSWSGAGTVPSGS